MPHFSPKQLVFTEFHEQGGMEPPERRFCCSLAVANRLETDRFHSG